jgi:hypothetical protein
MTFISPEQAERLRSLTPEQVAWLQAYRLRQVNYMRAHQGLPALGTWQEYLATYSQQPPAVEQPVPPQQPPPVEQPVPPQQPNLTQPDALAYIRELLESYGLGSLADWAWEQIVAGASEAEVIQRLRERPEYQARFPGMAERRARGLPAISEAEYIAYERQAIQMFRAAGLPEGFYDSPDDFARLIGQDVSVAELSQRVQLYEQAVYREPPEVLAEAERFGLDTGDLVAAMIDPDRALPLLQKKVDAAQRSAAAQIAGFGSLTENEATRVVELGVSQEQAAQGFSGLAAQAELFRPLSAGEQEIGRDTQIEAAFGQNAEAQNEIERRRRRRQAVFEAGGGFAPGQQGYAGLGG